MTGTLICCEIGRVQSKVDGSVSITFDTPEISGGKVGELFDLRKKVAYVYISARQIENNEKSMVDTLDPELKGKTPGQRLRGAIYVYWEQNKESDMAIPKLFEDFYRQKMEVFITGVKQELV